MHHDGGDMSPDPNFSEVHLRFASRPALRPALTRHRFNAFGLLFFMVGCQSAAPKPIVVTTPIVTHSISGTITLGASLGASLAASASLGTPANRSEERRVGKKC